MQSFLINLKIWHIEFDVFFKDIHFHSNQNSKWRLYFIILLIFLRVFFKRMIKL